MILIMGLRQFKEEKTIFHEMVLDRKMRKKKERGIEKMTLITLNVLMWITDLNVRAK